MLGRLKRYPQLVWIILVGSLIIRGAYYMIWPFISVILYKKFGLSATYIGFILSITAIGSSFIGFYAGNLSDRFGRRSLMVTGNIISVLAFGILAIANTIELFFLAITLSAIGRSLWDSPSKALLADLIPNGKTRADAFQLLYFFVNVGAAVGPLIGFSLGLSAQQTTFGITAFSHAILVILLLWGFSQFYTGWTRSLSKTHSLRETLSILKKDQQFLLLLIANILILFVFSHADSSLIQYLTQANIPQLYELISMLVIINPVIIILFQFPIKHGLRRFSTLNKSIIGVIIIGASQFIFAESSLETYWPWVLAMAVLSFGECIVFPNMSVQVDELAPSHLKGSYFGVASFYSIGYTSSPLIGGIILDYGSGEILFYSMAILSIIVIGLLLYLPLLRRPNFSV